MNNNKVQRQYGYSLLNLFKHYGCKTQCIATLFHQRLWLYEKIYIRYSVYKLGSLGQ